MNNKNNIKPEKIRKIHKDKESVEFGEYNEFINNPNLLATSKIFKHKELEFENKKKEL